MNADSGRKRLEVCSFHRTEPRQELWAPFGVSWGAQASRSDPCSPRDLFLSSHWCCNLSISLELELPRQQLMSGHGSSPQVKREPTSLAWAQEDEMTTKDFCCLKGNGLISCKSSQQSSHQVWSLSQFGKLFFGGRWGGHRVGCVCVCGGTQVQG